MPPKSKDGIRAKVRKDGYQTVHFEEYPRHWIASPEKDREKALKWAKRNRNILICQRTKTIGEFCSGFFLPDGKWVKRMQEKGHTFGGSYCIPPKANTKEPWEFDRHYVI